MYLGSLLYLVYVILKMESITCPFLRRERPFSIDHDWYDMNEFVKKKSWVVVLNNYIWTL